MKLLSILTKDQSGAGLILVDEEHFLTLRKGGKIVAVLGASSTTQDVLREADKHFDHYGQHCPYIEEMICLNSWCNRCIYYKRV